MPVSLSRFYMGAKKPRISDEDHAAFLEEFSLAVKDKSADAAADLGGVSRNGRRVHRYV